MIYIRIKSGVAFMALALTLLFSACDKGFEKLNTNPNAYSTPVLEDMFAYSLVRGSFSGGSEGNSVALRYCAGMIQHFASIATILWYGDKYIYDINGFSRRMFDYGYTSELKEIQQFIPLVEDNPDQVNLYAIARIWRVFIFHRITDLYGDVPYFDAAKGYQEGTYHPKYDPQEVIYQDMLKELDESAQLLDPAKPTFGSGDFIYHGDTKKWKKFAFSLMLRLGMRLTKVDPALAEQYVKKAIAGGVMTSNDDIAKLEHTDGPSDLNRNAITYWIIVHEVNPSWEGIGQSKLSKVFVDFLQTTKDPRLPIYSTLWQGNADPTKLPQTTDPSIQKGLPNGYDNITIKAIIPDWTEDKLAEYSELNIHTIGNAAAPTVFQSYSEVELLLAEASLRGWAAGDPKGHYEKGVTASMQMIPLYPGDKSIAPDLIAGFFQQNPYQSGSFEQQMEQIHDQMWVTLLMDNIEAYANWRRTGYPKLVPTNYPGNITGGTIPRRLPYPESERANNAEEYNAAVQRQGPDLFTTRVWWDKE